MPRRLYPGVAALHDVETETARKAAQGDAAIARDALAHPPPPFAPRWDDAVVAAFDAFAYPNNSSGGSAAGLDEALRAVAADAAFCAALGAAAPDAAFLGIVERSFKDGT